MTETIIERWKKQNLLSFFDLKMVSLFDHTIQDDAHLSFLLHLVQLLKNGYISGKVNSSTISPTPKSCWEFNETIEVTDVEWSELEKLILKGAKTNEFIYCKEDSYYFKKYWLLEKICEEYLFKNLATPPTLAFSPESIENEVEELVSLGKLLDAQKTAIYNIANNSISIISGGPGTGKTYTAGLLISLFWKNLKEEDKKICKIAIAAPTGKAAINLQKSLEKATSHITNFPSLKAETLHSLLKIKPIHYTEDTKPLLNYDLLIVDESSMIDIRMMSILLGAIKPGSRLIFLGDPYQLPPVEPGCFFKSMCFKFKNIAIAELKQCMRTDLQEIVFLASKIKTGDCKAALHQLKTSSSCLNLVTDEGTLQTKALLHLFEKSSSYFINLTEESILNEFIILSSLKKGPLGVEAINHYFLEKISDYKELGERLVLPIMITKNNSKLNVFNGDMGILVKTKTNNLYEVKKNDYVVFGTKKIPALLLPAFEFAFCITVHKSQGSEFNKVFFLIPEGSEKFGNELIYTGVTRARKELEIITKTPLLEKIIKNSVHSIIPSVIF